MNLNAIRLLLPCHSLEDFPTFHEGSDAENLLVAWTAAWHPAFLDRLQKLPEWGRVENIPEQATDQIFLLPKVSQGRLPSGFRQRASEQGGHVLDVDDNREVTVRRLAESAGMSDRLAGVSDSTVADFFALSYTYLQIELLTRQLRYTSNLDTAHFETQVLKAATAAMTGQANALEDGLGRCFDLLSEERHRYYPMSSYLCDITLMTAETMSAPLQRQLQEAYPANWIATATLLEDWKTEAPETWQTVLAAIEAGQLLVASGGFVEPPTALLGPETQRRNLIWGQDKFRQWFGKPASVYARYSPGLEITLPTQLSLAGFQSALHEAFQDTRLPATSHTYLRWQGLDGLVVPSLTKTIYDANQPGSFLKLGIRIGETLDIDHVAVSQFVHWPGQVSVAYADLIRASQRSDALGKWCLLDQLLSEINDPGYSPNVSGYDYRTSYLKQLFSESSVASNPIADVRDKVYTEHWLRRVALTAGLIQMADPTQPRALPEAQAKSTANVSAHPASATSALEQWDRLLTASKETLQKSAAALGEEFTGLLCEPGQDHRLIFNPDTQVRRSLLTPEELGACDPRSLPADQVYAIHKDRRGWWAVVDVPPLGYLHASKNSSSTNRSWRQPRQKIVSGKETLRNEFLMINIDSQTGGLRSLHDYQTRSNLCSLQLAWFDQTLAATIGKLLKSPAHLDWKQSLAQLLGNRETEAIRRRLGAHATGYSQMKADSVEVLTNNPLCGVIQCRGRLWVAGKTVAKYVLKYRLILGSRFLEIDGEITPTSQQKTIPLHEETSYTFPPESGEAGSGFRRYFAWRFAQAHPSAEVFRDLHGFSQEATRPTTTGPKSLEFRNVDQSLCLLTEGQAFHRFPADGKSDTLISPATESTSQTRIQLGLSPKNSLVSAEQAMSDVPVHTCGPLRQGLPSSAWLFRCSSPHVLVTDWENRYDNGRWLGVTLRLQETTGRSRKCQLEFAGNPSQARAGGVEWLAEHVRSGLPKVSLEDGRVVFQLSPYESLQLEVDFGGQS